MAEDWRATHADAWGRTVVAAVGQTYPWASQHVVTAADDVDATPQRLHPAFHGSFDWHSCVHMLWSGVTLLDQARDHLAPQTAERLTALLDARLTEDAIAAEVDLLRRRPSFERPYGWAWALQLAAATEAAGASSWSRAVEPLADLLIERFAGWLPGLHAPIRHGVHSNTAFALALAREAAPALAPTIDAHASVWFGEDSDYPVRWEPSGHDFLSPALTEAFLMHHILAPAAFASWLGRFLPTLGAAGDPLLAPAATVDARDGQAAHLLGLALSRAWHLSVLAPTLAPEDRSRVEAATAAQIEGVTSAITGGDFMATHWLVTFALKAASAREGQAITGVG